MLLELEKSLSLGIDATNLRESGAEEEEEVRNKEEGKEMKWVLRNPSSSSDYYYIISCKAYS